jgi:cell division protein FtsW
MLVGILLVATSTVALRLHLPESYFASHQLMILPVAIAIMISVSMLSPTWIRRLGIVFFLLAIVLLILTLFKGRRPRGQPDGFGWGAFPCKPQSSPNPRWR